MYIHNLVTCVFKCAQNISLKKEEEEEEKNGRS
jgi:hypothetical protein